eukprot:2742684-Amphidinium_carterae.1
MVALIAWMPRRKCEWIGRDGLMRHDERTVNACYLPEDSQAWLLEKDLDWKALVKGMPPPVMRNRFSSPDGLFPQSWPDPDEPDEMRTDSHLLAALVMDDYDNRAPTDQVFPNVPFSATLDVEGRIREMPSAQVESALTYAQDRRRIQEVQDNELYVVHCPSDLIAGQDVLLRVNPIEANVRTAARLGVQTTTMQVSIDPTVHPPVSEVSAPAFSGAARKLEAETPVEPVPATAAAAAAAAPVSIPPVTKAVPKTPPPTLLPSLTLTTSIPDQPSQAMLVPEAEWNERKIVMLRDGPKPWYSPREYGALPDHVIRMPVLPTIPPDALAEVVDLSNFATYKEWYADLHAVPIAVARDSEVITSYKAIRHDIIGFDLPVSSMSDLVPPSKDHVFIPIPWNAECVKPPYEDFYLDGRRIPPFNKGFTGYEGLPLNFKGRPLVEEEYYNRMIGLWKRKNEARREQAKMIAEMKG